MTADRELKAEVTVAASPEKVWATITDLKQMSDWSPELLSMLPLKRGGLRQNQWYVGINRRKGVIWPTRNVVAILEPGKTLAWDTKTSGARWIFEIAPEGAGTRLTQRRPVPKRLTLSGRLFAKGFLGGKEEHADELEVGMSRTLDGIKASVEKG
ncbi:MAG TPA: SRPBCC family protein [Nocardioidaceae bacterium]|nr:SRPBCC family protein [Nocardioidaceae bacterium]